MRMGAIFVCALVALVFGVAGAAVFELLRLIWPHDVSETFAILITGFLAAGVAIIAVLIAVWGVISARTIARSQTTLEHLARMESDGSVQAARKIFNTILREENGEIAKYAEKEHEGSEKTQAITSVLNEFELISIGIQRSIIDPELFKRWNHSNVLFTWRNAQPFVIRLRARVNRPTLYHEFEEMARWMATNSLPQRRFWWAGII